MDWANKTIHELMHRGIQFSTGLTDTDFSKIEDIYGIRFPLSLRKFYGAGLPFSDSEYEFPKWTDDSEANRSKINKYWLQSPVDRLLPHIKCGYWIPQWGKRPEQTEEAVRIFSAAAQKAPKLIPIWRNTYIPMLDGIDDPPVISAVETEIVYALHNLQDFLESYFLSDDYNRVRKEKLAEKTRMYIPFWSDIFNYNVETAAKNYNVCVNSDTDFKTPEDFI